MLESRPEVTSHFNATGFDRTFTHAARMTIMDTADCAALSRFSSNKLNARARAGAWATVWERSRQRVVQGSFLPSGPASAARCCFVSAGIRCQSNGSGREIALSDTTFASFSDLFTMFANPVS
eukprot:gene22594-biopygen22924